MVKKIDYSLWFNILKTGTYTLVGTIATLSVQFLGQGMEIKSAIAYGVSFGIFAGIKNFVKYKFNIDLDLSKLKA